jgi:hypothetical protein
LEPDVLEYFPNSESVNRALRSLIALIPNKRHAVAEEKQKNAISFHDTARALKIQISWDSHDLADYWDLTREVHFDLDIQRRVFLTALEPELAKKITTCAHQQGISSETLINVWLTEKLAAAMPS